MINSRRRRPLQLVLLAVVTALVGVGGLAAPASADTGSGWLRLAHLSPDTPSVDVTLTSFGNSRTMTKLTDVRYGDVSAYQKVPAGRYVASMTPAGGTTKSTPAISQAVTVQDGRAYTVAAVGRNAQLTGKVFEDDLRLPKAGTAKVRLLQASVSASTATVTAVGGPVLAQDAAFGSATGYAQIKPGIWTVTIDPTAGSSASAEAKVTATPNSVNTIVVLDGKNGKVTATVVKDASGTSGKMPKKGKGVDTGGGGTATVFADSAAASTDGGSPSGPALVTGIAALALLGSATVVVGRRRRLG